MSACTWSDEAFYKNEAKAAVSRVLATLEGRGALTFDDLYHAFDDEETYARVESAAPSEPAQVRQGPAKLENVLEKHVGTPSQPPRIHSAPRPAVRRPRRHRLPRATATRTTGSSTSSSTPRCEKTRPRRSRSSSSRTSSTCRARWRRARRSRKPFSVYVDEARNALYDGFVGFISQCHSAGIGLVLASQSPLDFTSGTTVPSRWPSRRTLPPSSSSARGTPRARSFARARRHKGHHEATPAQMVDDGVGATATGALSERAVKEFPRPPRRAQSADGGNGPT